MKKLAICLLLSLLSFAFNGNQCYAQVFEEDASTSKAVIPFGLVEVRPMFGNGDVNAFSKWLQSNIDIPTSVGVSGRIMYSFIVNETGAVSDVKIVRGVHPDMDKAVINTVQKSPRWTPGRQSGKPVRVSVMMSLDVK